MDLEEGVMRPVWFMRGYEKMESGSFHEGFRSEPSDLDVMLWRPDHKVICDPSQIRFYQSPKHTVILMECEDLPPGFTRLKLISPSVDPLVVSALIVINSEIYVSASLFFRAIYNDLRSLMRMASIPRDPLTTFGSIGLGEHSTYCFRSNHWPDAALPWIKRCRRNHWPPECAISLIIKKGVHIVSKSSPKEDNMWMISFSGAEQNLMYSMNHSQFLCYGLLKIFLREVIGVEPNYSSSLCSDHMKTITFWVIQEENGLHWVRNNLLTCFWTCFKVLISWVYKGECPNFFIPENNMFRVKVVGHTQVSLFEQLYALYSKGISCLLISPGISSFLNATSWIDETRIFSELYVDMCLFREFSGFCEIIVFNSEEVELVQNALKKLQKSLTSFQILTTQHILSELYKHSSNLLSAQTTATTKELKYSDEKALNMIKLAGKKGCASDILYVALHYHRNCQYEESLRCLKRAQDRMLKPYVIYNNHVNEEEYELVMAKESLSNRMRKCLICDIRLHREDIYIDELVPEQEVNKEDGSGLLFIPPLVMLYMLFVINYHRLGDTVRSQRSLQDLHTLLLSDDGTRVPDQLRDISWQILGICQQTCGDYVGALTSFLCSLRQSPQQWIQKATMLRLLIINYKLFVAKIISVSTSTNLQLMIDNK